MKSKINFKTLGLWNINTTQITKTNHVHLWSFRRISKLTIELLHLHHGRKLKGYLLQIDELQASPLRANKTSRSVQLVQLLHVLKLLDASLLTYGHEMFWSIFLFYYVVVFIALDFTSVIKSYPTVYYFRYCKDAISPWGSINFHIVLAHLIKPETSADFRAIVHFTVISWYAHRHSQRVCLQALADIFADFILSHLQEICYCTSKKSSTIV